MTVLVIVGSLILFAIDEVTGRRDPGAGDLSRLLAPPPLDSYATAGVADGNNWRLAAIVPIRVAFLLGVLGLLLRVRPTVGIATRLLGWQLAGLVSFAVVVRIGNEYFAQKASALEDPSRWPLALVLLIAPPVLITTFVVMLAPLVVRTVSTARIRPLLNDGVIWICGIASTWLWLFGTRRIDAAAAVPGAEAFGYALAFAVLIMQSVLFGAIAFRTLEVAQTEESVKTISSIAAPASARR